MKKTGKGWDNGVIFAIVLVFLLVIGMNVSLIYNMISDQTEEIGEIQLDSIKGNLQETISDAENALMRVAIGVEQLMSADVSMSEVAAYMEQQKAEQIELSNGMNFNVYVAGPGWEIIPDFDVPADFHATERLWYKGAAENFGDVYITEPYIDSMSAQMCFSISTMLSDQETVVGMDFNLSGVQQSIREMTGENDYTAMIVTKNAMIVGYTDMSLVGAKLSEKLPEYQSVLNHVIASKEHPSFHARIGGVTYTIFSSETNNEWYMILCVDNLALYQNSYLQLIVTTLINLVMLIVIIFLYRSGAKNRVKAEEALEAKERFLMNLSGELNDPLLRIIKYSDPAQMDNSANPWENMTLIRESGLQLSEMLNNLFSYSVMIADQAKIKKEGRFSRRYSQRDLTRTSRIARNGMIAVMVFALLVSAYTSYTFANNWADVRMQKEADGYENQLEQWITQQQSILSMFTDMIAADPEILDDYEEAVHWLDAIASNYSEISVCYMTNPYKEHTVIMNNGWEPDEDWRVEERQWYIDTERSDSGYGISAPYLDEQTGYYCITLSRIVYGSSGEFLGIFGIDFFMDKLIDVLGGSYSSAGYAFMVDSDGVIINHPNESYQMSDETSTNIEDTKYSECYYSEELTPIRDYDGALSVCLCKKNELSGFSILVVNRWWSVYSRVVGFLVLFIVLFAVCIAAIIILVNRMIRWQADVNRQLLEAADAAVSAGKAKSQFLAQMSHEIRTPINAVIGMDEMILRESDDESIREYAANIRSAGKTLLSLINGILDFSKIEDGKMEIIPVSYEVLKLVDDLVNMISEKAAKKGLELRTQIDPKIPRSLFGDDVRIRQIITNILTNAVKYTHQGSVTLSIGGECAEDEADVFWLDVEVRDTGIGIRSEDIEKLFQSFQRLDEERNRNIEGTGLGISIVQKLLAMMDSELKVESVYGHGSTFSFRLRQKIVDKTGIGSYEGHRSQEEDKKEESEKMLRVTGADVLVVDDNEMNLKVAKGLMKRCGAIPDLAESGGECLERVRQKHYDIIFMDHMMPEMDGVMTLRKLQELKLLPEDTVVIVLTANAIVGAKTAYLKEGFADYLSKPIVPEVLEEMLAKYLPEEKVSYEQETAEEVQAQDFVGKLRSGGFNTRAALQFTAEDPEFYKEMLEKFARDADEKSRQIQAAFEQRDWKSYQILVHGLKSTSRTIGADELSNLALGQEDAAKHENEGAILAGCEILTSHYRQTVEKIVAALAAEQEKKSDGTSAGAGPEAGDGEAGAGAGAGEGAGANASARGTNRTDGPGREREEIGTDRLREELSKAADFLDDFEADGAEEILSALAPYSYEGHPLRETLDKVYRYLDDFDLKAAAEEIRGRLEEVEEK